MDYNISDSSGTDDDLPPHQNRFSRGGRASGNNRSTVAGSGPFSRMHGNMETQIHHIEQEAYGSVLRAFKAQSDAITWEKESLITELRKELRVSDEEHRELLSRVNADDIIRRIREWRKAGGSQPVHDSISSPTVSASRKKQKTSQSMAPLHIPVQPSSSVLKRGPPSGGRGKKPKSYPSTDFARGAQVANKGPLGAYASNDLANGATRDPLIGRKIWTRWPEDNHFYEAVITDYNPVEGRHALLYDMNTANETWEWVNLKEISPEDVRWEGEESAIPRRGSHPGPGRGNKRSMPRGGAVAGAGRGRGIAKGQSKKVIAPSVNGVGGKASADIEILHTDTLIKEVEKVFGATHPDPLEIEKAKKVLKEHEQALVDAISRLEDASDGESDEREPPFSHVRPPGQEDRWREEQYGEMAREERVVEHSGGDKFVGSDRPDAHEI